MAASGSRERPQDSAALFGSGIDQIGAEPLGKNLRWVTPGSRLLPTDRTARLQSGCPPGAGHATLRSLRRTIAKYLTRIVFLILPILLSLSGITFAEPVIILDPYFYRTPVSEAIDGSTKTVLGYYDETDGKVTSLPDPPRLTIPELHTLAVAYAQSILKQTSPKIIRDRHGVIVAIRIENQDPAFSSVLLTPGFTDRFENLLGKDCLVCVPNRQTVFLFPRLGGNMEQFSIPLRGIYHNSVWPVSTELFEWRGGALHAIRDFEPN